MRTLLLRWVAICLLAWFASCGPDTVAVRVRVKNLPADAAALQVNSYLDCKPAREKAEFSQNLDQLAVTVPKSAIETGRLVIEVSAVDRDRCETSRGRVETTVSASVNYSEVDVSLEPQPTTCTLTIDQAGEGSVLPLSEGVAHRPQRDDLCGFPGPTPCTSLGACDFPKGQMVTLTSARDPASYFVTDWRETCPGQSYGKSRSSQCSLTINSAMTMRVRLSDGFCTPDDWCYSSPAPQPYPLYRVWVSPKTGIGYSVGEAGTVMRWDGAAWSRQEAGTKQNLRGVWGVMPTGNVDNVWAVGAGGTIIRWGGSAWSASTSGTTANLESVWGSSNGTTVWAVGAGGTILRGNGSAWSPSTSGTTVNLKGVWSTADGNMAIAVGAAGTILRWNGTAWSPMTSGTTANLEGVWGADANNIWAVGEGSTILKWNGAAWTPQTTDPGQTLYSVWGLDASNVWVTGITGGTNINGLLMKWDTANTKWATQYSGTKETIYSVGGVTQSTLLAVGGYSTLLIWRGTNGYWAKAPGSANFLGIWGTPNDIWAVGESGTVVRRGSFGWVPVLNAAAAGGGPTTATFSSIWGTDKDHIWAIATGSSSAIFKWDGSMWTSQARPEALRGIWGVDSNNLWATGTAAPDLNGVILRTSDGQNWTSQYSGSKGTYWEVWGSDQRNVWTFGQASVFISGAYQPTPNILKWDGGAWSAVSDTPQRNFFGAWGTGSKNIWVGTDTGLALRWDGARWFTEETGTGKTLYGIWGTDEKNVWAVGRDGVIVRWDGSSWSPQASGTTQFLLRVWGRDTKNIWAVGNGGTILNYLP